MVIMVIIGIDKFLYILVPPPIFEKISINVWFHLQFWTLDKMTLDKMTLEQMTLDQMTLDQMT